MLILSTGLIQVPNTEIENKSNHFQFKFIRENVEIILTFWMAHFLPLLDSAQTDRQGSNNKCFWNALRSA